MAAPLVVALVAAPAGAAKPPKPTVAPLQPTVTALTHTGGTVGLSSTVDGATTCELTATPSVSGLPASVACPGAVSRSVTLPKNETAKPVTYKFTLAATGPGGTKKVNAKVKVAKPPKPSVTPLQANPASLSSAGGNVGLSSTVDLFTTAPGSCTFSANRAVSGLPTTVPCSSGGVSRSVAVPPNTGKKPLAYKFTLKVSGPGGKSTTTAIATATTEAPPTTTAPGQVTNVVGVPGDAQVALSWSPPASDGGSALTGYQYQSSTDGGGTWSAPTSVGTSPSTIVTGLTNGTAYRFRVAAVNANGPGAYSTASAPVSPQATQQTWTQVAGGGNHTCAITSTGAAKCWGSNDSGQLGDGTTTNRNVPVQVQGLTSGVTQIAAGGFHSCAIVGGAAKCWGDNSFGGLGDGTILDRSAPVQVSGLTSGVTQISAANGRTCAIVSGSARCWGLNDAGQVGDGTILDRSAPVQVSGLTSGVTQISTGYQHTCAVVSGAARCWGDNQRGQLGDGTGVSSNTPVQVSGFSSGVTQVGAGYQHTCGIVSGAARCWGFNGNGRLGDGTTTIRFSPVQVQTLTSGVTQIAVGHDHSCVIVSGAAKCWGVNADGQLGDGTSTTRISPVQVSGLTTGVTQIATGDYHTCAITGGAATCWGFNVFGQVGDGTNVKKTVPTAVTGP